MKWFKPKESKTEAISVPEPKELTGIEKAQLEEQEREAFALREAHQRRILAARSRIQEIEAKYGAILQELASLRAEVGVGVVDYAQVIHTSMQNFYGSALGGQASGYGQYGGWIGQASGGLGTWGR